MQVSIPRASVARVAAGKKDPSKVYFDLLTPDGSTFAASTKALTFQQLQEIALLPVKIDGEVSGRVYEGRQVLTFDTLKIGKLG